MRTSPQDSPWRANDHAARRFLHHVNPWILIAAVVTASVGRLWTLDFSVWDAVIVAGLIAVHPFQEWLIHVYILHWRPRQLGPLKIDFELARRHRHHHSDPGDLQVGFMPTSTLVMSAALHAALWWTLMPTAALAWTGMLTVSAIGLLYEWTHYIVHTSYKPQSATAKRVFRYHRLHHFKNENYWMGVTMHLGDRVLGTMPDQREVPNSPTARDLAKAVGATP
jgi:hypothetical protein